MAVTPDLDRVQALVGGAADADVLLSYMDAAAAVVTDQLGMTNQPEARLTMIAEHLAAHYHEMGGGTGQLLSVRLPDYSEAHGRAGDLSDLRATRNGRIAVELDQSDRLAEASKPKPSFAVL